MRSLPGGTICGDAAPAGVGVQATRAGYPAHIVAGVGHDSWTMTYNGMAGHDIDGWFLARYKPR